MAAKHRSLGEFDSPRATGSYTVIERAKQYFAANNIADGRKQQAILLSSCGDVSYRTIKDVMSPTAPGEASFKTIVDKMTKHLQPSPSEIVQHCRSNTGKWKRRKRKTETESWNGKLKRKAETEKLKIGSGRQKYKRYWACIELVSLISGHA